MPDANRFVVRKALAKSQIGEVVFASRFIALDHTLYEVAKLINVAIAKWQKDPDHPERSNYKLHVLGGSLHVLPMFTLEHKIYGSGVKVPDVWDLDVEVIKEGRHLRITVKL